MHHPEPSKRPSESQIERGIVGRSPGGAARGLSILLQTIDPRNRIADAAVVRAVGQFREVIE
jgi:hypothetical protein